MPDQPVQNLANHGRFPTAYVVTGVIGVLALILCGVAFFMLDSPSWPLVLNLATITLTITVLVAHTVSRFPLLVLQDRIVRLESEVRCERLLPEDLKERARGLTLKQRVASRFASDAEFPALIRKVLDENIQDSKAIKQLVQDWQGDYKRV